MARLKVFIMLIRHAAPDRSIFPLPLFSLQPLVRGLRATGLVLGLSLASAAHAGLFDDNEARQAILDLRADVKQVREGDVSKLNEQNAALQRSLLDLQAQIQEIKQNQAKQTGRIEELENRLQQAGAQHAQVSDTGAAEGGGAGENGNTSSNTSSNATVDDLAAGSGVVADSTSVQIRLDGQSLQVAPEEKRQFDAGLVLFQAGNFAGAERSLGRIVLQNPKSAYAPWVHYWVGNSQFAQKRYAPAIDSFKRVISLAPSSAKAPEAALSIANCQAQIGQQAEVKRTLQNLIAVYPRSEAADSARERLARI